MSLECKCISEVYCSKNNPIDVPSENSFTTSELNSFKQGIWKIVKM